MPFSDSVSVTTTLPIKGVWLHDPDNPEETLSQFPYGADSRSDSLDTMGVATYYVGMEEPVFDYGDASGESVDVSLDVLNGPDYVSNLELLRSFARSKKQIWFRDNRGRAVYGTMSNFKVGDQAYGAAVSFTLTRAYRVVTETV